MTEWKEIKGFSDYEISSEGEVRRKGTQDALSVHRLRNGYISAKLYKDHKPYARMVHRLVAAAFLGDSDLDVNHIDGDKSNNRVSNLEYATRSENMRHAYKLGLVTPHAPKSEGKRVVCLTNGTIYASIHEAGRMLGVDTREISRVCRGKRKSAKGFRFAFAK